MTTNKIEIKSTLKLNQGFIVETQVLKSILHDVKDKYDKYNDVSMSKADQIRVIERDKTKIFSRLDIHFERIAQLIDLNRKDDLYKAHQDYYQKELWPYLCTPPLNKRICEKPLGYNGDYLTISYYYKDDYEGETIYEKLIHRYTLSLPIARAVINRLGYFYNQIAYLANNNNGPIRILSIGSGPAKEIIEFYRNSKLSEKCIFNCIDAEKEAAKYVYNEIEGIQGSLNKRIDLKYYDHNILQYVRGVRSGAYGADYHLIYSAGMFDYLGNDVASKIVVSMYNMLADGGKLIVTNFNKDVSCRAYLELFGDWNLILRDEQEMLDMAKGISIFKAKNIEYDESKQQLYLVIEK